MTHVHAIPEITHWSQDRPFPDGGVNRHACYFCRPHLYEPMPKNCTICIRCGVFIWTGLDDKSNETGLLCEKCDTEVTAEVES